MEYIIESTIKEVVESIKESVRFRRIHFEKEMGPNHYFLYYRVKAHSHTYVLEQIESKVHVHFFVTQEVEPMFSYKKGIAVEYLELQNVLKKKNIKHELIKEVKPKRNPWDGWIE